MIVTILGGSAPSTAALVDYLATTQPQAAFVIRLAGRTPSHLSAVTRACRLLAQGTSLRVESYLRAEWPDAIDGADRVLIQIREGGLEGRLQDETFPRRYGIPGDEGLGPGGLNAAIRTWPVLRDLLKIVERRAPGACTLLLTSPAGLLVRAVQHDFPGIDLAAICELPWTTLRSITQEDVTFGYTGVNHLGWLHDITHNGRSLASEPVPLKYLQLHFDRAGSLATCSRAPLLMQLRKKAYDAYAAADVPDIRAVLALRPTPWYTYAVGPLLADVVSQPYFLTRPHVRGERAYRWTGKKFHLLPSPQASAEMQAFVERFVRYEEEAVEAVLAPSRDSIEHALQSHPWTPVGTDIVELATEVYSHTEAACPV